MTASPFPLPRETRESAILVGNGTPGPYGPSGYKVWDTADVVVYARADGEEVFTDVTADCTITKTASALYDTFSVTFAANVPATTDWYHQARRTHERQIAATQGGAVSGAELEKELAKQATILSETRRDIDRALRVDLEFDGSLVLPVLGDSQLLKWDATAKKFAPGPVASEIEAAEANAIIATAKAAEAVAAAASIGQPINGVESVKTDDYTVLPADVRKTIVANKASAIAFGLPAVASAGAGFHVRFFNIGAGALTINGTGAQINGKTSIVLARNQGATLFTDGTAWRADMGGGDNRSTFATVAAMLADSYLAYAANVASGDTLQAGGYRYQVAASGASDHDLATAGGVKLYALPSFGVLTEEQFGAPLDGDWAGGGTDATAAIQKWAASTRGKVKRFVGVSRITAEIAFNPGDVVEGASHATGLDASAASSWATTAAISVTGAFTAISDLSGNVARGAHELPLTSAAGVSNGDVLLIYNPTDSSWSPVSASYRAGEFVRVHSLTGSTVNIFTPLYAAYNSADVDLYRLDGKQTIFRNFRLAEPTAAGVRGLLVEKIDSPVVHNVRTGDGRYIGVELLHCYDFDFDGVSYNATPTATGNDYGLAIINSQKGRLGGPSYGTRHSVAFGGSGAVGAVPCRDIEVHNFSMGVFNGALNQAQDVHGNVEDIRFFGGTYVGGIIAGKNIAFYDVTFIGSAMTSGICIFAGSVHSGSFIFNDCIFRQVSTPGQTHYAPIYFDNFNSHVQGDVRLIFNNPILEIDASVIYGAYVAIDGCTHDISVEFNSPRIIGGAALDYFIRTYRISGTTTMSLVSLNEITGLVSGAGYTVDNGSGLTITRYRLPRQQGRETFTGNTSNPYAVVTVTYDHPYPAEPHIRMSNYSYKIGDRAYVPYVSSVTGGTSFNFGVQSSDDATNFSSTNQGYASWEAWMD
ncbi:hypothetical protein [Mesorhizobium sp. Z1-4]|uniref:phage tailspike polysaccharide lyase family protein n=1 Tax=Mesorhizobium sp. Z1-4 TaxID=2448478 RepID=UPI000FDCA21A|nr:hypothetical protein [Mesorhizobium sp. Z1-4]